MQTTRKLVSLAIAVLASVAWAPLRAQNLNAQDQKFIQAAAKGGMMEVHMGRLGAERGGTPGAKTFSQMLISDHTKGNQELMALAKQKGVILPPDDAKMVMSMPFANKSGAEFDREFVKEAVEDHQKDIAEFEKEANTGADADVRNWAKQTLPTLRAHLASAEALQKP